MYSPSWAASTSFILRSDGSTPTPQMPQLPGQALLEEPVDVHRLMGAVEATDTEMHYPDADFAPVIGRLRNRQLRQGCVTQVHDTVTTALTLPGVRS